MRSLHFCRLGINPFAYRVIKFPGQSWLNSPVSASVCPSACLSACLSLFISLCFSLWLCLLSVCLPLSRSVFVWKYLCSMCKFSCIKSLSLCLFLSARPSLSRCVFVWKFLCSMYKFSCIKFHSLMHAYMYVNDALWFHFSLVRSLARTSCWVFFCF